MDQRDTIAVTTDAEQPSSEHSAAPPWSRHPCEAVPPFHVGQWGWVYDANGSTVLVCDLDYGTCPKLWAEDKIVADAWFMCCECNRLGQRMEEATPARCGIEVRANA